MSNRNCGWQKGKKMVKRKKKKKVCTFGITFLIFCYNKVSMFDKMWQIKIVEPCNTVLRAKRK